MKINIHLNQLFPKLPYFILFFWLISSFLPVGVKKVEAQTSLNGLLQNYNAFQTAGDHEMVAGRNRLRFELNRTLDFGGLYSEVDLVHRYNKSGIGENNVELQFREAYFDWHLSNYDIRIGKQNIIWGRTNGGFITDILTPVDLREFLTVDPENLRTGITAINITRYSGSNSFQFIFNPVFQRYLLPNPDSRWFPAQTTTTLVPVNFVEDDSPPTLKDMQVATQYRWRGVQDFDLDLMLYYGTHPVPTYAIELNLLDPPNLPSIDLVETYNASFMTGYSLSYQFAENWILTSESLYVLERVFTELPASASLLEEALSDPTSVFELLQELEFRDDGYLVEKPWIHSMIGLQTTVKGTTISAQGYLETIFNYDERILPQQYFTYATVFLNRSFLRERLQMISSVRYNFNGDDYWFHLQSMYELADGLEIAAGTNLFAGKPPSPFYGHFNFNQFRGNSFAFVRVALYF